MTTDKSVVVFDELVTRDRFCVFWGFFWRGLLTSVASGIGGGLAGFLLGFILGFLGSALNWPSESIKTGVSILGFILGLVLLQGDIDGFRATQMIQDKAQSAGNGRPFSRTATPYWIIWVAPFGRAGKRSSAVLRLLARADHSRRGAPCGQPLPDSLNPSISP